tara:strand:+ start:6351 stop:7661 length:1311 start_codon:yes stop_codon:yes gene_type:complete
MASQKIHGSFDVIVIGSGTSGLASACILGKFGKKVLVLEQHDRPGGCLHTFQEKGYTFQSGNHYIGHIDPLCQKIIRTCGSSYKKHDGMIEQYIWDGKRIQMHPNEWEHVMKAPAKHVARMADHMWWIAIVKLTPAWIATIAWWILNTFFPQSFAPYGEWMQQQGYAKWWKMQEGDIGCAPIAMVGAAVARHYMHGTSFLSDKFVRDCCRTIRKQNGQVVVKHTVERICSDGVVCNGSFVPCKQIISSIGAMQTCKLVKLPKLQRVCQNIGQGITHSFVFVGVTCTQKEAKLPNITWIKEGEDYLFISAEEKRGKTAVNLIAEMPHKKMVDLFKKHFPYAGKKMEYTDYATKNSVKKYLGRFASYGLECSKKRFAIYTNVRTLRPETEMPNLFLTGQDILMPGIVSAMTTALMTCRQVLHFNIGHTILQKDLQDIL